MDIAEEFSLSRKKIKELEQIASGQCTAFDKHDLIKLFSKAGASSVGNPQNIVLEFNDRRIYVSTHQSRGSQLKTQISSNVRCMAHDLLRHVQAQHAEPVSAQA
ncbi:MAG: hypothetical protein DYH13_10305 [Alphaproteobacteria bacterium PRO2]|nr:hypothetical protein [Alphaproteobacteria bacterium PRO2]